MSHPHISEESVGILSLVITFIASWVTGLALEIAHGMVTLIFGVLTTVAIFFVKRYLENRYGKK